MTRLGPGRQERRLVLNTADVNVLKLVALQKAIKTGRPVTWASLVRGLMGRYAARVQRAEKEKAG